MNVFLVRHADADAEIPDGLGDEARALTAKARGVAAGHFSALAERFGTPGLILTSPLVRTVQTAQLLATALGYEGLLKTHRALLPDMPVGAIDSLLQSLDVDSVICVGHQPSMGAMTAHLLGQGGFTRPFNPGTVVGLAVEPGASARLLFYAPPGQSLVEGSA